MKTSKKILLGMGGVILAAVAWYLGSPLFITNRVSEPLPFISAQPSSAPSVPTMAPSPIPEIQGTFTGFDKLHQASGTARIITVDGKRYVRFEEDFTVTNGPDLFVYLGHNNTYDPKANLGRLKGNEGSQNYEIPESISLADYSEVWVWCRAFSVPFGKAVLQ